MALLLNPIILHKIMPEVWGLLPKSQVDDELIEEAIARLILEHNEDETAHLGTGQSLQSHKASEIIDHLVNSIITDKILKGAITSEKLIYDRFTIISNFESLDGWSQGGVGTERILCVLGGTSLETGAVNGDTAYIKAVPEDGAGPVPSMYDLPQFQITARVVDKAYAEAHLHIGRNGFQAAGYDYIGFRLYDSKIYAVARRAGSSEVATDITGVLNSEVYHTYKVEVLSVNSVVYYIDGVYKTEITTPLPLDELANCAMFIGVRNPLNGGEQKMGVIYAIYQQDF
jgi:hypothetical protein